MNDWDNDTTDESGTGTPPRQQSRRSLLSNRGIFGGLAVVIVVVLAVAIFGYLSLNRSGPTRTVGLVPAPTTTTTQALQPTATTSLTPSRTATSARQPTTLPTAPPTQQPRPSPTVAPSPKATPSPAILAVTPTFIANMSTDCAIGPGTRTCTFTLSNQSSASPLSWTGTAMYLGRDVTFALTPSSGTIPPGGTASVTFTGSGEGGVCSAVGTSLSIQFTGPNNAVTTTIDC